MAAGYCIVDHLANIFHCEKRCTRTSYLCITDLSCMLKFIEYASIITHSINRRSKQMMKCFCVLTVHFSQNPSQKKVNNRILNLLDVLSREQSLKQFCVLLEIASARLFALMAYMYKLYFSSHFIFHQVNICSTSAVPIMAVL